LAQFRDAARVFPSSRAARIAEWMANPAGLMSNGLSVATEVDLDQARRCHLPERHPIEIDEKVMVAAGRAGGEMGEDEVVQP
jgi:hypothetical protein